MIPLRTLAVALLGVLAPALMPALLSAQDCELVSSRTLQQENIGTPQQVTFITDPVVRCPGGRRLSAQSAILSDASGLLQLSGNVEFQDSARSLTSTSAQYFSRQRRLSASGRVVLVHRTTRSIIRSEQLEYLEASPRRTESLVQATGGRPRAVIRQASAEDSTLVDAMQIEIIGEGRFRGTGDAVLTRDSLRALGYVVEYLQDSGTLHVSGLGARVEVPRYELFGDSITARVGEDDRIEDVLTRHNSRLEAEEMRVAAPAIRMFFTDGGVSRMVAMQWTAMPGAQEAARPHVENDEFRMDADSLDVLAPEQRITEAIAIGAAYGERITPDSLRALLPEVEPAVMRLIANDWMRGDTVRAFFTDGVSAAEDTVPPARVMDRLQAAGSPAQSMYRMKDDDAPEARLSINYMVGTLIEVLFRDGAVAEVSSPGATGMFLQPAEALRRGGGAGQPPGGGGPAGGAGGDPTAGGVGR